MCVCVFVCNNKRRERDLYLYCLFYFTSVYFFEEKKYRRKFFRFLFLLWNELYNPPISLWSHKDLNCDSQISISSKGKSKERRYNQFLWSQLHRKNKEVGSELVVFFVSLVPFVSPLFLVVDKFLWSFLGIF